MASKEFEFYVKADLSKYKKRYAVIIDEEVVATGDNAKELLEMVKIKYPDKKPLLIKIPSEETLILKFKWK